MLPTAKEFRYLRKKAGLTQKDVAKASGMSQSLIARIEAGDIDTKISTAQKILDVIAEAAPKKSKVLTLEDVMASPVEYCKAGDTIKKVAYTMESKGISQLPVMEAGKPIGSVTDTVVVEVLAKKGARASIRKIRDIMDPPFPVLDVDEPLEKAVDLLTDNSAILISRGPHVAGIMTKADALKIME